MLWLQNVLVCLSEKWIVFENNFNGVSIVGALWIACRVEVDLKGFRGGNLASTYYVFNFSTNELSPKISVPVIHKKLGSEIQIYILKQCLFKQNSR